VNLEYLPHVTPHLKLFLALFCAVWTVRRCSSRTFLAARKGEKTSGFDVLLWRSGVATPLASWLEGRSYAESPPSAAHSSQGRPHHRDNPDRWDPPCCPRHDRILAVVHIYTFQCHARFQTRGRSRKIFQRDAQPHRLKLLLPAATPSSSRKTLTDYSIHTMKLQRRSASLVEIFLIILLSTNAHAKRISRPEKLSSDEISALSQARLETTPTPFFATSQRGIKPRDLPLAVQDKEVCLLRNGIIPSTVTAVY
jgi:hypothetical protein